MSLGLGIKPGRTDDTIDICFNKSEQSLLKFRNIVLSIIVVV